jgi:hypothetical protein
MGDHHRKAFVVMPFDDELLPVYEQLIKPALEQAGYSVTRADTRLDQQNVMRDVVAGIAGADLIVADVTARNANVMYELGIAHGLRRPTITITQSLDDLPFDLRPYRALKYSHHFEEAAKLKQTLTSIGDDLASGALGWGSPVTDFAPDDSDAPAPRADTQPALERNGTATGATDGAGGFLDYLAEGTEATAVIVNVLSVISASTAEVGAEMVTLTGRLHALQESEPGSGAVRQYQRIAILAARAVDAYAERLESALPDLESESARLVESGLSYAGWLRDTVDVGDADESQAVEFAESIRGLLTSIDTTRDEMLDFRESVQNIRGVAQPLNKAAHRATRGLDRIIAVEDELSAYCSKTLSLLGMDTAQPDAPSEPPSTGEDGVLQVLENAPDEDEIISSEEEAAVDVARAEYRRGEFQDAEQVKRELG